MAGASHGSAKTIRSDSLGNMRDPKAQPASIARVGGKERERRARLPQFKNYRMKEIAMNKDQAAGGWKELKGKIKQQWGKLTDDDLTVLEGSADELSGRIQKRYGIAKEEAEKQVKTFRDTNSDLVSRW
jgi:uncharacterized protein YjbJ (UPF0337 family)